MLQMYGEKAEETEELKLDIQDLKSMYRQQVCVCVGVGELYQNQHVNFTFFLQIDELVSRRS